LGIDAPQKIQAEVVNYDGSGSLDTEVDRIARIIEAAEYAERERTNTTTLTEQQDQGFTVYVENDPSAEGTTTA
jgi:hypothetical protein